MLMGSGSVEFNGFTKWIPGQGALEGETPTLPSMVKHTKIHF